jgi:hypothetical protein
MLYSLAHLAALYSNRHRSTLKIVLRRATARFGEPRPVCLHRLVLLQPIERLPEYLGSSNVRRHHDAIVHPLPIASCRHNACIPKVGQMTGNLRLWTAKDFHEVANADFLLTYEIKKAQARVVAESLKESLHIELSFDGHALCIRVDEYECNRYICVDVCEVK